MEASRASAWTRARLVVLALLTLLVVGGVPGEALRAAFVEPSPVMLPKDVRDRDGRLEVTVRGARGEALTGARVQAYAIMDGSAYLASSAVTDDKGLAPLTGLPAGEHWIVADAAGYSRGSSHVIMTAEPRAITIELGDEHKLEVRVVDERGEPVARADIEVVGTSQGSDPLPVGARAGPDGTAIVGRLGKSPWTVTARATGYEEVTERGVKEGSKLVVTLRKLGALVVTVVGPDKKPAPGARVTIAGPTLWPARSADTDKDGVVKIAALASGSYAVRATRGDGTSAASPQRGPHQVEASAIELGVMLARGEEKAITLELLPGRMIAVRVVDADDDDAPIAKARVSVAEGGLSPFPIEGRTGKDGTCVLGPIAPGPATVAARADGYVSRGAVRVPESGNELTIALPKAGALTGRVVDTRGYPIDGATVEVIGTDFFGAPIADSPARSSFREAHFESTIEGPKPLVPAGELGVMPGPVPPIPHAFSRSEPSGASGAAASARDVPDAEPWVTKNDGTFRAAPASPGRVRALVRHPQYVEALSDVVTLKSGGEADVQIVMHMGGSVEGRVVDARDQPVAGVRVHVAAARGTFERSTRSASDGTFAFAAVPPEVVVMAYEDDDATQPVAREALEVPEGGKKEVVLKVPDARDPLPARVVDDRGYPIEAAQITAHSLDPSAPVRSTAFTNASGEAKLARARGVALRVEVTAPGLAPKITTTLADADKLEVTLARAESAEGEVRSTRGDPIEGADVTLYTELGARHVRTKADGTFAVGELAAGSARVRVRASGFAPAQKELTIAASGGQRPFAIGRIELASEATIEGTVVDERGDPVQGARVAKDRVPTYLAVGSTPPGVAVTDARGRFKLGELPGGTITLEAFAPDVGRVRHGGVRTEAGRATINVTITLTKDDAKSSDPGASGGVAVTLGETSEPREVVVVAVAEASEAERAGLAPNDVLLEVNGARVRTIEEARAKLNGPMGDDVVVKIRRGEAIETVRVAREAVRR